jgi:hypothetical protein
MTKEKIYKYLDGKLVTEMYDDLISFDIPHEKTLSIIEEVTGERIIRFKDLKFELHPMSFRYDKQKAIRSHGLIKNKWYSIVGGGKGLYGDGVTTFEVWTEKLEEEGIQPFGYCKPIDVEKILLWLI